MGKGVSIQDLLDSGISIEELLFNREKAEVNVTVDTSDLIKMLKEAQDTNAKLMNQIKDILKANNVANKDLLMKAMGILIKDQRNSQIMEAPITGLHVIRDETDKIADLEFIRDHNRTVN